MNKFVLLVDDEAHMLRLLQFALQSLPAKLVRVRSSEEAMDVVKQKTMDLIILDYSMPGKNGVQTLREIREAGQEFSTNRKVPVIMLTARDQTLIRREAAGLEVSAFLTKPFSPSDLLQRATELLKIGIP